MMLALTVVTSLVTNSIPIFGPTAADSIGFSAAYVGYVTSIVYISGMLSALAAGNLVARHGAIRTCQAGLVLCAIGLMLVATALMPLVVAGAVLIGLGYGPISPASSHVLAKTTPPDRMAVTFSIRQTGVPLGGFVAGLLIPTLVLAAGWQLNTLLLALVTLACILTTTRLRAALDHDRTPGKPFSVRKIAGSILFVVSHAGLRRLALMSFAFCTVQLTLTTYLVAYLTGPLGMPFVLAGFVLAITQLASVIARIFWGWVADRFLSSDRMLVSLGIVMSLASLATATMTPQWPFVAVIALMVVFGSAAIGWNGVYMAEIARIAPPGTTAATTGASLFFAYLGGMVGPAVFASIVVATGSYPAGFVLFGLVTLAISASALLRGGVASDDTAPR